MSVIRSTAYLDTDKEPAPATVTAKAAALGVGLDTAAVLSRRDDLKAKAAAYRAKAGADLDVATLFDFTIAAIFDS